MDAHRRIAADSLLAWWRQAGVDAPLTAHMPETEQAAPKTAKASAQMRTFADRVRPQRAEARKAPRPKPVETPPALAEASVSAREAAASCTTLQALKAALEAFDAHPLHATARNTVFARGDVKADVMVIGEAPGREEDVQGLPFVGRSGQLLDRMFAAIGLSAENGLYITNILNWRPPGNRNPNAEEIAACLPFVERHIALKKPKLLVLTGGVSAQTLLQTSQGITRLRGRWTDYAVKTADGGARTIPALPIYHPAFVLRRPIAKREVWRDLLALEKRLKAL